MKKTLLIAAAFVALTACNKTLIETQVPESDYGYINLGITADTEMVETKATGSVSASDGYSLFLKDASNNSVWKGQTYADDDGYVDYNSTNIANESIWTVPAGTYTLVAENMTEAEALVNKGFKRLKGEVEKVVNAGLTTNFPIVCKPVNSLVTANHTLDSQIFANPQLKLTAGERSFDNIEWGHDEANGVFYSAGTSVTWELIVTLAADNKTKKKYTSTLTTIEGKWSQINFSSDNTDGTINVSITYDDSFGEPTTSTVEIKPLEGIVTE